MTAYKPDIKAQRARSWLVEYPRAVPLAIFLLIAAITVLSVYAIERGENQRRAAELSETARAMGSALERRSYAVSTYLRSGAALLATLDEISPASFNRFVRELQLDTDYRGAEGIGWAKAILPTERSTFETEIGTAIGTRVVVRPEPVAGARLLVPVTFLFPTTTRNTRAVGYDMYSERMRADAMRASLRSLRPTASAPVTLAQEGDGVAPGFLIYMPVFESGISNSKLRGFVYSPYNAQLFLRSAQEREGAGNAAFRLFDERVTPGTLLAQTPGNFTDSMTANRRITVADRSMVLQTEIPVRGSLSTLSMLTALFGMLVGCLLTVVARLLTQQALEDQTRLDWFEQQNSIRDSLTRELNHRVKNTLANVLSIIQLTRRRTNNLDEFASALDGRIRALSATHDLLTQSDWGSTPVRAVVAAELAPYITGQDDQAVEISGPDVELAPNDALSLGLAVHELATNAAKYGALSEPGGKVSVNWTTSEQQARVQWTESGGPTVAGERKRGFGTDLIEKIVAHELRNPVELDFAPTGVRCSIVVLLRDRGAFAIRAERQKASSISHGKR